MPDQFYRQTDTQTDSHVRREIWTNMKLKLPTPQPLSLCLASALLPLLNPTLDPLTCTLPLSHAAHSEQHVKADATHIRHLNHLHPYPSDAYVGDECKANAQSIKRALFLSLPVALSLSLFIQSPRTPTDSDDAPSHHSATHRHTHSLSLPLTQHPHSSLRHANPLNGIYSGNTPSPSLPLT